MTALKPNFYGWMPHVFCLLVLCVGSTRQVAAQQVVITGGKETSAASTSSYASRNVPAGTTPSGPVDGDDWYDNTQNAEAFQQSTHTTVFRGGTVSGCVNVSPVTASANLTSAQGLMSCTIPAQLLNTPGKTLKVWAAGLYSTNASGLAGTITISIRLGMGNDICARVPNANFPLGISSNTWDMTCYITTQTAGASGKFEAQGLFTLVTNATTTNQAQVFPVLNTTTVPTGTVDTTSNETLQVFVTFSANNANTHSAQQRQLVVEVVN